MLLHTLCLTVLLWQELGIKRLDLLSKLSEASPDSTVTVVSDCEESDCEESTIILSNIEATVGEGW